MKLPLNLRGKEEKLNLSLPKVLEVPGEFKVEEVRLEASKTALIIVDMQNDFVKEGGKLRVPEAEKTISPIRRLLEKARERNVTVIYTQDWHEPGDPEFKIWGEHAVAGTWGAEVVEELKPREGETLVKKLSYDGFYGTPLDHVLRTRNIENLVITGTVANICVLHTAGSAALRGYKLFIPVDCISALNEFDYALSLRQITFLYRGKLTSSEKIEFR